MNMMDLSQWMTLISNYGFPLTLSLFVLFRLDKKMDQLLREWNEHFPNERKDKNHE